MSPKTLKILILIALTSLLAHEIAALLVTVFSHMWGYVVSLFVAGVTFFCTYMASGGTQMKGWYLVPTVLFVVVPTSYKAVRIVFFDSKTNFDVWVAFGPVIFGFLLPAGILLFIFWRLLRAGEKPAA